MNQPETETDYEVQVNWHFDEILSYHGGYRKDIMRKHLNAIIEGLKNIHKMQFTKVVKEIKDCYDDSEPEYEKGYEKALSIILKNIK